MRLFLIAASFLFLLSCDTSNKPGLEKGSKAPSIVAKSIDGKDVLLENYKGKVVMLYFWADWCPACKEEFPATARYYEKLRSENFELLAINVGQDENISKEFKERYEAKFPMLTDINKSISETYKIKDLPANVFINPKGEVIRTIVGWVDENQVRVMKEQNK